MNHKLVIKLIAIAAISFSAGLYFSPKEVETKTVEKVVYREKEQKTQDQNFAESEKETRLPDGTVIKEKTKTNISHTETKSEKDSLSQKSASHILSVGPQWRIGVGYEPAINGYQDVRYTGILERRILGELFLGVSASSEKSIGIFGSFGF